LSDSYTSCIFIEQGLTLAPDGLYFCSLPLHGSAGWADIGKYEGGELPIDLILAARERHRSAIRDGSSITCNGCEGYLYRGDWHSAFMFNNLNIEHYTICNLRCSYCCWNTTHPVSYELFPYRLLPVLQQLIKNKLIDPKGWLFWGGGEPALLDEFGACVELATAYGIKHDVSSNATLFSPVIATLLKDRRNTLVTSVDAGTPETYLKVRGSDYFHQVWGNLQRYAEITGGDRVSIKYIITEGNTGCKDLEAFVYLVNERNLTKSVIVDISHHLGYVPDEWIGAAAELTSQLESSGVEVLLGIHGAHTLPREKFTERVRQAISTINVASSPAISKSKCNDKCYRSNDNELPSNGIYRYR
jgi:poly(ribitol-phosphate) beta-N-acetylglucosaminyltransferase